MYIAPMAVDIPDTKRLLDDMITALGAERIPCPESITASEFPLLYVSCSRFEGTVDELKQLWDTYPQGEQPETSRLEEMDTWRVHTHSGELMRSYYIGPEEPGLGMNSPKLLVDIFLNEKEFDDAVFVTVRLFQ
jgi:hypothetical protein